MRAFDRQSRVFHRRSRVAIQCRIAGKFGESRAIRQTKTIQISTYN